MKQQTSSLGQLGTGIAGYAGGVTAISGGLDQLVAAMAQDPRFTTDPSLAPYLTQLTQISTGLGDAAEQGSALASGASGLGALASGISQSASGAARLAANGSTIASGAQALADGNAQLATGASELSSGLQQGAEQLSGTETPGADAASVAAEPVGLEVSTENAVGQLGQVIGTYFVPLGLWVGALAIFLVLPRLSRRVLASTAGSGRVLGSEAVRAGGVAALQALLLVLLLHLVAGVSWALLPATLGLSLVAALAFTAFHQLLTVGLGRTGLVISLLVLGVQLASVGGILPSQALAGPFAWISSVSPLGWASTGLQQIVAGGDAGVALGSGFALAAFGAASLLASRLVIRRARRASVLRLLLPAAA
jgi:putative membrane protein